MHENNETAPGLLFDLSDEAWEASILKAGTYDATVVSARVSPKNSIAWLKIVFEVTDENGEVRQIEDFSALDAPSSSARYSDTAKGKGRVKAILEANGKPLAFSSVDQVPAALNGCRVSIVIGSRTKDGLRVPIVDSIRGPASASGLRAAT
jgi:hypothetical protein